MIEKILYRQVDVNHSELVIRYDFSFSNIVNQNDNSVFSMALLNYVENIDISLKGSASFLESQCINNYVTCSVSLKTNKVFQVFIKSNKYEEKEPLHGSCWVKLKTNRTSSLDKEKIYNQIIQIDIVLTRYDNRRIDDIQRRLAEKIMLKWFKEKFPDLAQNLMIKIK